MKFDIWKRYRLENGNNAMDLVVVPEKNEVVEIKQRICDILKATYPDTPLNANIIQSDYYEYIDDLYAYVEISPTGDISFGTGGFPLVNENIPSELYLLTGSSELLPLNCSFDENEKSIIKELYDKDFLNGDILVETGEGEFKKYDIDEPER